MKKPKLLVLSIFPAPYRAKIIDLYKFDFDVTYFYERCFDSNRNPNWFVSNQYILTKKDTKKRFNFNLKHLQEFNGVVLFDYTSINSIRTILKCKVYHIPYFVNCDGVIFGKKHFFIFNVLKKFLLKSVSCCFASGEYAKKYFINYGVPNEKIIIHNFTSLESSNIINKKPIIDNNLLKAKLNIKQNTFLYLGVGRFFDVKNYSWLLSNWSNSSKRFLILIGGGEQDELYRKILKTKNLLNVRIIDYLDYDGLADYFYYSDFFIHPTKYDSWGLVINEAMANGCLVVSSNKCVSALELIEDGENGFIFDVESTNLNLLCNQLESIDPVVKNIMVNKALEKIKTYTIENMAKIQIDGIKGKIL